MIYNEIKEPLFVHFYINSTNIPFPYVSANTAEDVYTASNAGVPVIGVIHEYFDENSVRVYTIDEVESIFNAEEPGDLETPCIIDFSYQGEPVYPLMEFNSDVFSFLQSVSDWMDTANNHDVMVKAKLREDTPEDYYVFGYDIGIEAPDSIYFENSSCGASITTQSNVSYTTREASTVVILPLFTTSKCELETGVYTYYAVFQSVGFSDPWIIQMKNNLIRRAEYVEEDMLNWIDSNDIPLEEPIEH